MQVVSFECPGCGAPLSTDMKECPYCHGPVLITSFHHLYDVKREELKKYSEGYKKASRKEPDSTELKMSAALCFLRLKLYDIALEYFEQLMKEDYDNSENYFYAAICLLQGKRACVITQLPLIRKAQNYLSAAIDLDERGVYHLFLAYLKLDYYAKKHLKVSPSWDEELAMARASYLTAEDARILFNLLNVEIPDKLRV